MKQYKVSTFGKVFLSILAVAALILGGFLFLFCFKGFSFRLSFLFLVLAVFLLWISIQCVFYAYRSFIEVNETGVLFYDGIGKRENVPFAKMLSYNVYQEFFLITYTKQKEDGTEEKKSSSVYFMVKGLQEIIQNLSQHGVLSDEEKVSREVSEEESAEFVNGEHGNLTQEERNAKLKKATMITKIITVVAVAAGIWYLFFPDPYSISTGVNIALSLLSIIMLKISDGWIHFDQKRGSKYPTILSPFIISSAALCLGSLKRYDLYEFKSGLFLILAFWAGITVLFFLCQSEIKIHAEKRLVQICCTVFLFAFFAIGASIAVNCEYDYSEPNIYFATVKDKSIHGGKSTTYYLTVAPWIDGKTEKKKISVSKREYDKAEDGQMIAIGLQKGLFNVPWYWAELLDESKSE